MNTPPEHPSHPRDNSSKTLEPQGFKDDPEDRALVERTVSGDATAFEQLFVKYRQRLFGVAWRLVRNEDTALDVVQEAFVRAFQQADKLRGEARFYPWLRRIAVNLAIDQMRHARRGVEVGFDEAQFGEGAEAAVDRLPAAQDDRAERESPLRQSELSEFSGALQGALEQLSEAHRAVFMLHASEGMSYREIAEALNCNIGTVMSRLFYARKKLQELLAPHLEAETRKE